MIRILMIDDNQAILKGLTSILKWDEYGVETIYQTTNPEEALEIIRTNKPDILITDIKMPGMDGLALMKSSKHIHPMMRCIVLSGFNDFDLVREALKLGVENYLLKPLNKDELSETVLSAIKRLEKRKPSLYSSNDFHIFSDNILYRWATNKIDIDELKQRAQIIGINLLDDQYAVAIIALLAAKNQFEPWRSPNKLYSLIAQSETNGFEQIVFFDQDERIIIIFHSSKLIYEDLKAHIDIIMNKMEERMYCHVFSTIGSIQNLSQNVYRSFYEANALQEYSLVYPPGTLLDQDTVLRIAEENASFSGFNISSFTQYMINKDADAAKQYINTNFASIFNAKGVSPTIIRNLAIEILLSIYKETGLLNDRSIFASKSSFLDILRAGDKTALLYTIYTETDYAFAYQREVEMKSNPIIKQVLNYIDKHYSEGLSLKTISGLFHINTSYLGQLFKLETGSLFSDYLNEYRIAIAKDLLQKTHIKVHDIAAHVGFTSPSYFFKMFRKVVGISPTDFRNKHIT